MSALVTTLGRDQWNVSIVVQNNSSDGTDDTGLVLDHAATENSVRDHLSDCRLSFLSDAVDCRRAVVACVVSVILIFGSIAVRC